MIPSDFLAGLKADPSYGNQIVHVEYLAPRAARYGKLARPLIKPLADALAKRGARELYLHQAQAIDLAREGQ